MSLLRDSHSLLLTGVGEVWAALYDRARRGGERSGLLLMVIATAAFALMAGCVKKFLPDTPTQAVVLSRGVMMTALFVAAARRQGAPLIGSRPWLLLGRGLIGYGALSCYFYSVQHLPLGDAVLLQYSHPVFVAAMAPLLLGERGRARDLWLVVLALLGVGLIVRPEGTIRPEALVGVVGSLLSGFAYMAVRRLSRSERPLTILVWFPLATIPPALVAAMIAGRASLPRDAAEVAGHLLVTLAALVGQVTLTHGLTRAGAARATAVTLTGPVFGLGFGYLMFATVPSAVSLAGTAIVLLAMALLAWRRE